MTIADYILIAIAAVLAAVFFVWVVRLAIKCGLPIPNDGDEV